MLVMMQSIGPPCCGCWKLLAGRGVRCQKTGLMHEGSITIRITAEVTEIERLNRLVRQFGELHEVPMRALYSVNLALDELVTNVVHYGFEKADGHDITVFITVAAGELVASVTDRGREFNPLDAPAPDLAATLAEREIGGLGIHLARNLMDHASYERADGKNVLTVRKRFR